MPAGRPTGAARCCAKLTAVRDADRARLAVAKALLVTVVAVFTVNACGSFGTTTGEQTLTAPVQFPRPEPQLLPIQTIPSTTTVPEALGIPIAIPFESYAQEPIVEYGSIEIPRIGLVHQTFHGVTLHNIDQGPSHWPGSATPGKRGNAVFAGHRVTHSHPFLRINELELGDEVIFRAAGIRSVYRVTESLVVGPDATWIADQTAEPTATLYACHPPGSAAQRYVVKLAMAMSGPDV